MEARTTKMLFEFESLFDMRSGCIRYLINSGSNTKFYRSFMRHPSSNMLKNLYVSAKTTNPMEWILKNEYKDSADDLYKEIMDTKYDEVLKYSVPTDVYSLFKTYSNIANTANAECAITCDNQKQADLVRSFNEKFVVVLNQKNLGNYNCLYVNLASTIDSYSKLTGKHVYLHNIMANYDEDMRINGKVSKFIGDVVFHTVDPYIGVTLFTDKLKGEN